MNLNVQPVRHKNRLRWRLSTMAIIDHNETELVDFLDVSTSKIVGPVIRMKSGLILQALCLKPDIVENL